MGVELAAEDRSAAEIAETLESARVRTCVIYVALETLEYLKKGGRISGAQAAIGTLLSVKPIIKLVKHGVVETADRVRTRSKARERLHGADHRAPDRAAVDPPHDHAGRRGVPRRAAARVPDLDPADGHHRARRASVGPHLGPGCVGAAILYRPRA